MIIIKSEEEIDLMRISGKVTGTILRDLADFIKPGISTADIDRFCRNYNKGSRNDSDLQRIRRISGQCLCVDQ